jgi:hypothetical protein
LEGTQLFRVNGSSTSRAHKRDLFLDVPHQCHRIITKLVQKHLLSDLVLWQLDRRHPLPSHLGSFPQRPHDGMSVSSFSRSDKWVMRHSFQDEAYTFLAGSSGSLILTLFFMAILYVY